METQYHHANNQPHQECPHESNISWLLLSFPLRVQMVGVGMVWHQFLRSSLLLCVFLSAVEFEPFFVWGEVFPSFCPCLEEWVVFWGVWKSVCVCVGNWGFPVRLHTKHSSLQNGWIVGQVHSAGSHIRSSVFVLAERCPTRMHTQPDTHKYIQSLCLPSDWKSCV